MSDSMGPEIGDRNPLDLFQFALTFVGIFFAIGGVVVASPPWACFGLLIAFLGLAYFGRPWAPED